MGVELVYTVRPMRDPLTLDLNCQSCGGGVTVQFKWAEPTDPRVEATWACPDCNAEQRVGAIGRVTLVLKRHQDTGSDA
jgi:hypothetical protein